MPDGKWVSKENLQTFWQMVKSNLAAFVTEDVNNVLPTIVPEELNKVLPTMVGEQIDNKFGDDIGDNVTSWLTEHVTPTGSAVVVDDTLTIAGAAADAKKTGDEISGLKEDITHTDNAVFSSESVVYNNDSVTTTTAVTLNKNLQNTIPNGTKCKIEITINPAQAANCYLYFRNSSGNINGIGYIYKDDESVTFEDVSPTADATMIRFGTASANTTYTVNVTSLKEVDNVQKNTTDISRLESSYKNISKKTSVSNVMTFKRGYWNTPNNFKTLAQYRVGAESITFDKDVVVSALNGLALSGYIGSTYFNTVSSVTVPANTALKLFVRRVYEDNTEIADITEFTAGIYILNYNALTEYAMLSDTFAGIEMFRTAGFIGDSYTATRLGYSWVDIVQGLTGVTCTKFAKSGDDSGTWISDNANGLPALLADSAKDLYWIALGINDGGRVDANSSYLGSISDLSGFYSDYPDTFWGNMGHIIESIQAHAPNAKIVLYKPIFKSPIRTLSGVSATQNGINDCREALDGIAEHYELPIMDALDDVLFESNWYVTSMDYAVSAGTHPSILLYPAIAKANLRLFSKCVQANHDYFIDINYAS